jgi:hypothetical protein
VITNIMFHAGSNTPNVALWFLTLALALMCLGTPLLHDWSQGKDGFASNVRISPTQLVDCSYAAYRVESPHQGLGIPPTAVGG